MFRKRFFPMLIVMVLGCALQASWAARSAGAPDTSDVIKEKDFVIVTVKAEESLASLAQRYLGSIDNAWLIAEYNGIEKARAGQRLVIPLQPVAPGGLAQNGYQTVPVLYYPLVTAKNAGSKAIPADLFTKQLQHLRDNGFETISLDRLYAFLDFREQLPAKAVVITFDTTMRWAYEIAYPILLRHGMRAAIFIQPDRIGRPGHMTWSEVNKLAAAGFDIGAGGLSGRKLTRLASDKDAEARIDALEMEIGTPCEAIRQRTKTACRYFAYPYGASDDMMVALLKRYGYRAAFTQVPGSNPFFVDHFKIKRSLVRNDKTMAQFLEQLKTFNAADLR